MRWPAPFLLFLTFYLVSQRRAAALPAVNYTSLVKERILDKRGLDNVFMVRGCCARPTPGSLGWAGRA